MPAKIGGRVTAPAASAPDFLGETGRRFWRFTRSRPWQFGVDLYPVLVAAALPWSTSAVLVFMSVWFIALIPTIEPAGLFSSLRGPPPPPPDALFGPARHRGAVAGRGLRRHPAGPWTAGKP